MKDKSIINSLSYLKVNKIIKLFKLNHHMLEMFMIALISRFKNIKKKEYKNISITNYYFFVPQPYKLLIDDIDECVLKKKEYHFTDSPVKKILCGNFALPHYTISSIPFLFCYTVNNKCNLKLSNVYYYEVTLGSYNINHYNCPCISIGFGSIHNNLNNKHVGWDRNSVGVHSDDGKYFNNSLKGKIYRIHFSVNDTIGAGLIYISKNTYKPFFTKNGKLFAELDNIFLHGLITPQIGYEHCVNLKVNFGNKNFKFKIDKIINSHNNIISTKNNFVHDGYKIKKFTFNIKYYTKKIKSKILTPPKIIIKKSIYNKKKYIKLLKVHDKYEHNNLLSEGSSNSDSSNNDNQSINIIGKKISTSPILINNNQENISNWDIEDQSDEFQNSINQTINNIIISTQNHIDSMQSSVNTPHLYTPSYFQNSTSSQTNLFELPPPYYQDNLTNNQHFLQLPQPQPLSIDTNNNVLPSIVNPYSQYNLNQNINTNNNEDYSTDSTDEQISDD